MYLNFLHFLIELRNQIDRKVYRVDGALRASFYSRRFSYALTGKQFRKSRAMRDREFPYTRVTAQKKLHTRVVSRNWVTVSASDRFMRRSRSEATTGAFISALFRCLKTLIIFLYSNYSSIISINIH